MGPFLGLSHQRLDDLLLTTPLRGLNGYSFDVQCTYAFITMEEMPSLQAVCALDNDLFLHTGQMLASLNWLYGDLTVPVLSLPPSDQRVKGSARALTVVCSDRYQTTAVWATYRPPFLLGVLALSNIHSSQAGVGSAPTFQDARRSNAK